VSEFETEYAPGLPERLPEGERLLWQGKPQWRSLAVHAFHVRSIAIYFAILMAWRGEVVLSNGGNAGSTAIAVLWMMPLALAAVAMLALLAWFSARTTIYTITTRRIIMRFGIALPMTLNIPFRVVDAAGLSIHRDGMGNIPLRLAGSDRVAFVVLWPHARPWRVNRPEPMLRSIPNPAQVAQMLSRAMVAESGQAAQRLPESAHAASGAASRPLAAAAG
jgi:Bacterial PH domain